MKNLKLLSLLIFSLCWLPSQCLLAIDFNAFDSNIPLEPDQAFKLYYNLNDKNEIELDWQIAPNYQLYRDATKIIDPITTKHLYLEEMLPAGKLQIDDLVGNYYVLSEALSLKVKLTSIIKQHGLLIHYQGCIKNSICYPPINKLLSVDKDSKLHLSDYEGDLSILGEDITLFSPDYVSYREDSSIDANDFKSIAFSLEHLTSSSFPIVVAIFFLLGLLLTFTPCVLPMLPLVANLIVGPKENINTKTAVTLVVLYVLSMSLAYSIAGVGAGYLGSTVQAILQTPLVIISVSILILLLALMQFEVLPALSTQFLSAKLKDLEEQYPTNNKIKAIIMGALAALVIAPCATPVLIGALTYIAQTGNPWLGGLALFTLGLGMGTPLLMLAWLGGRFIPKAGPWLQTIQHLTGIALLGLTIWLISRILSSQITMLLWSVLFITSAVYFATTKLIESKILTHSIAVIIGIYGLTLMMAALGGNTENISYTKPLQFLKFESKSVQDRFEFKNITSLKELNKELLKAKKTHQPVLIKFSAAWCITCNKIERTIANSQELQSSLSAFTLINVDLTDGTMETFKVTEEFKIYSPPAILFIDKKGNEHKEYRLATALEPHEFIAHIKYFLKNK